MKRTEGFVWLILGLAILGIVWFSASRYYGPPVAHNMGNGVTCFTYAQGISCGYDRTSTLK